MTIERFYYFVNERTNHMKCLCNIYYLCDLYEKNKNHILIRVILKRSSLVLKND